MRVAIVGPSPCIVGLGLGDIIDGYDVVCRVNNSYNSYKTKSNRLWNKNRC